MFHIETKQVMEKRAIELQKYPKMTEEKLLLSSKDYIPLILMAMIDIIKIH
jgi:hypothetical protein